MSGNVFVSGDDGWTDLGYASASDISYQAPDPDDAPLFNWAPVAATSARSCSYPMTVEQTDAARKVTDQLTSIEPDAPARRLGMRVEAGEGQRFTERAARRLVGQRPRFDVELHGVKVAFGQGTVTDAAVLDDGRALWVTIDQTAAEVRGEEDPPTMAERLFRGDTWSALFGVPVATDPGDRGRP